MNILSWSMIGVVSLLMICIPPIAIYTEKKYFNNGKCPICNARLKYFGTDSQGGRGYCCEECDYHTWVSWNTVDKQYRKQEEAENNDQN